MPMKRKKRRGTNCVCSAKPSGEMKLMDSILLHKTIKEGLEKMSKEKNPGSIYNMGMHLGNLCKEKGWKMRAIDVWDTAIWLIENDDMRLTWGSWEEGSRQNELNCYGIYFDHVTSEELCVRLGKEIDRLWRETGHKELATSVRNVRREYRDMWLDLYYMCL